jgi:tetratricopeptide (TPR) repeat protein
MGRGFIEQFAGRPAPAEAAFAAAVDGFRVVGDRWGMANSLDPLALLALWRGDRVRALALVEEGLRLIRELEAPEETADLLTRRASVSLYAGEWAKAAGDFTQAAELARTAGLSDKVASALRGLGDAARLSGDPATARAHYEAALEASAANWFSVGETVRIFIGLGRAALAEERREEAHDWYEQARALALEQGHPLELAAVAEALASSADSERAALLLGAAEALRGTALVHDPDLVRLAESVRKHPGAYERGRALRSAAVSEP